MTAFRDGQYPIDSFIMDYDWCVCVVTCAHRSCCFLDVAALLSPGVLRVSAMMLMRPHPLPFRHDLHYLASR